MLIDVGHRGVDPPVMPITPQQGQSSQIPPRETTSSTPQPSDISPTPTESGTSLSCEASATISCQQEIITDGTTPIPAPVEDAVPVNADSDDSDSDPDDSDDNVTTPPPQAPAIPDGIFANFEKQKFGEFMGNLNADLEALRNALELTSTMPQPPLAPPMVLSTPAASAPSPLLQSVALPIVACAPAFQSPAAEMDVSLAAVAGAGTIHPSTPPLVFLPAVDVATQPHLYTQSDLYTADDMEVDVNDMDVEVDDMDMDVDDMDTDVEMVDDFAPPPTIVYQMDKCQLELTAVPEPEKFAFDGRLPTVTSSVDVDPAHQFEVAEAWYNRPASPELGTESMVGPYGFNPHHTEPPCMVSMSILLVWVLVTFF